MLAEWSSQSLVTCHDGHACSCHDCDAERGKTSYTFENRFADSRSNAMATLEYLDGDGMSWAPGRAMSALRVVIPRGKALMLHLSRDTPSSKFRWVCDVRELCETLEVGAETNQFPKLCLGSRGQEGIQDKGPKDDRQWGRVSCKATVCGVTYGGRFLVPRLCFAR
jgi:hypothetical protein